MGVEMYSDIIGTKTRWYSNSQVRSERTQLYVSVDVDGRTVICRDYSRYVVTWFDFDKESDLWR